MGNTQPSNSSQSCGICTTSTANTTCITLACCGAIYHQKCLKALVSSGATNCPSCASPLPSDSGISIPAPPAPAPALRPPPVPTTPIVSIASMPEEPVERWVPPPTDEAIAALSNATIVIEAIPELPQASLDMQNNFHTVVSLTTEESSTGACNMNETSAASHSRPPMDVICVLDTSGSMSSCNKLVNLKHAVDYVRSELTDKDRMAVINFENSATLVHDLLLMNDSNKQTTTAVCSQLRPGGGTSIVSGLDAAYNMISTRATSNPITSVFLLTDGIDSSHMARKKTVSRRIKEAGCSLFVFGFGNDHDSAHLQAIADAGDGTFTYIEQSDMVVDAFGGALGAEQSIFATEVCLRIQTMGGTTITTAETGSYRHNISSDRHSMDIYLSRMMIGEERDMLLTLSIPACESPVERFPILCTSASYISVGTTETKRVSGSECHISRVHKNDLNANAVRDERVEVQCNRMVLLRATRGSLEAADRNDYSEARRTVEEALRTVKSSHSTQAGNPKCAAFVAELNSTLESVSNREIYTTRGGRHNLAEQTQTFSKQKLCYAKAGRANLYQSKVSASKQSEASASKRKY